MNAKELLVQDGSERKCTERLHTSIVNAFRIFVLAFQFECEEICQVSALVIASQEMHTIRIPDLQRPQVKHALHARQLKLIRAMD